MGEHGGVYIFRIYLVDMKSFSLLVCTVNSLQAAPARGRMLKNPVLEDSRWANHSPLASRAIFGSVHFFGAPGGFLGVVMADALGYVLAKSLRETRALFWAWSIHCVLDVIIIASMISACGSYCRTARMAHCPATPLPPTMSTFKCNGTIVAFNRISCR